MVSIGPDAHGPTTVECGVPQGSIIGPTGFVVYTEELAESIAESSITFNQYADDTAMLSHIPLADVPPRRNIIERSLVAVRDWFQSRRLQLNADKTELI